MKLRIASAALLAAVAFQAAPALAQVAVKDPWVRATVPHQKATGAFMQLNAAQDTRLVGVKSPIAAVVEVHEMKMVDDVMKMRAVGSIDLVAGKPLELKPGGYHVMLIDLKQQVKEGDVVPVTLVFEGKDNKRFEVEVKAPVRPLATAASGAMKGHGH